MGKNRKEVLRLAKELHDIKEEIEEDLDLLVDKELIEEIKKMGIL